MHMLVSAPVTPPAHAAPLSSPPPTSPGHAAVPVSSAAHFAVSVAPPTAPTPAPASPASPAHPALHAGASFPPCSLLLLLISCLIKVNRIPCLCSLPSPLHRAQKVWQTLHVAGA